MVPSWVELESICQKPRWREVGSWLARRVARPAALYLTWLLVRWPVSAHAVTAAALCVAMCAACLLGAGTARSFVIGTILLQLWYVLDHVDGQVARFRRTVSVTGIYLDYMMHHAVHAAVGFALGFGLAERSGELRWALAGALIALGMTLLAISNDCRYKAFHAALASIPPDAELDGSPVSQPAAIGSDHVGQGGAHLRWLLSSLLAVHRLLLRSCEIPNVLVALAVLAVGLLLREDWGWLVLGTYVLLLAVVAPIFALARLAKQVWTGLPDKEFAEAYLSSRMEKLSLTPKESSPSPRLPFSGRGLGF